MHAYLFIPQGRVDLVSFLLRSKGGQAVHTDPLCLKTDFAEYPFPNPATPVSPGTYPIASWIQLPIVRRTCGWRQPVQARSLRQQSGCSSRMLLQTLSENAVYECGPGIFLLMLLENAV